MRYNVYLIDRKDQIAKRFTKGDWVIRDPEIEEYLKGFSFTFGVPVNSEYSLVCRDPQGSKFVTFSFAQTDGNCNSLFVNYISSSNKAAAIFVIKNLASLLGDNMILMTQKLKEAEEYAKLGVQYYITSPSIRGYRQPISYGYIFIPSEEMATTSFNYLVNLQQVTKRQSEIHDITTSVTYHRDSSGRFAKKVA